MSVLKVFAHISLEKITCGAVNISNPTSFRWFMLKKFIWSRRCFLESFRYKLILPPLTVGHISCAAVTCSIIGTFEKFLTLNYVEWQCWDQGGLAVILPSSSYVVVSRPCRAKQSISWMDDAESLQRLRGGSHCMHGVVWEFMFQNTLCGTSAQCPSRSWQTTDPSCTSVWTYMVLF